MNHFFYEIQKRKGRPYYGLLKVSSERQARKALRERYRLKRLPQGLRLGRISDLEEYYVSQVSRREALKYLCPYI